MRKLLVFCFSLFLLLQMTSVVYAACPAEPCDGDQYCDENNECQQKKFDTVDCQTGAQCLSGICNSCTFRCTAIDGCTTGLVCENNACVTKIITGDACTNNTDCASGFCSTCTNKCATEQVCPVGQSCNFTTHTCQAPIFCAGCDPATEYCDTLSGNCTARKTTGDCKANEECTTNICNTCTETCSTEPDCGATGACVNNACITCDCNIDASKQPSSPCFNNCMGAICGDCANPTFDCVDFCSVTKETSNPSTSTPTPTSGANKSVVSLPNPLGLEDPNALIGRVIKYIIGLSGTAALAVFIYGGAMWLISHGDPNYVTKGKKAMFGAIIGLVIIFSSYVLVRFVISVVSNIQ